MTSSKQPRKAIRTHVRELSYIALFAALMAICAWISIPIKPPFTMQTFAVFAAALLLGPRRGTIAVAVYLAVGALGAPVFSGFGAGIGHILASTGGYMVGFLFSAAIAGCIAAKGGKKPLWNAVGCALGLLVCYAFGTAWFMFVYARSAGPIGLGAALSMCVLPFVIPDAAKIALAILLDRVLSRHIRL